MDDLGFILFVILMSLAGFFSFQLKSKKKYFIFLLNIGFFLVLNSFLILLPIFQIACIHFLTRKSVLKRLFPVGLFVIILPLAFVKILDAHGAGFGWLSQIKFTGLAFYTLQLYAYYFDVWSYKIQRHKSILELACYSIYFPNLISGPVERPASFLGQLNSVPSSLSLERYKFAVLIFCGVLKKFVFANNLSEYVMPVIERPYNYGGPAILITMLLSKFFLYYDISGYSDMAVGISGFFGVRLTQNFNRPLWANNMKDFWQRWHISVSTWIRDYIFFPLLTTKVVRLGLTGVLFVTFFLFGLWHGFTLPFVIYGMIQGLLLRFNDNFEKLYRFLKLNDQIFSKTIKWLLFYPVFIAAPSVLFFSTSVGNFLEFIKLLPTKSIMPFTSYLNISRIPLWIIIVMIVCFEIMTYWKRNFSVALWYSNRGYFSKLLVGLFVVLSILAFAKINENINFIYGGF